MRSGVPEEACMRWLARTGSVVLTAILRRRTAAMVVGVMALLLGIVMLSASTVTCGDTTMHQGDVCETTGEGSAVRLTYDEQKQADQRGGRVLVAVGIAGLLLGAAGYAITAAGHIRNRRGRATGR
jgi:hypothetical protein